MSARPSATRAPWNALIWPGLIFMAVLFLFPFVQTAVRSVTDPGPENFRLVLENPAYRHSLVVTFLTAVIVTLVTLAVAYPYAYLMYRSRRWIAQLLMALVLLPFFTSLLVRTYAWTVWLQQTGIINSALMDIGLIDSPIPLMRNTFGVAVGMTHALLPFMVFPLYASMRRVPPNLLPAAMSLGAHKRVAFRTVFVPLTTSGIVSGSLIVFVMSLGYYVTPALLGTPKNAMLSEHVVDQIEEQLSFGLGAALGMVLLILTLVVLLIGTRVVRFRDVVTGGRE